MKTGPATGLKKLFLIVGALLTTYGIIAQFYLVLSVPLNPGITYTGEVIRVLSYMTIWMNILAAFHFVTGWLAPSSRLNTFLTTPIIQTGTLLILLIGATVYHFFLANTWNPTGMQAVVDTILHYAVPIFYLVYWLLFGVMVKQDYKNCLKWLLLPLVYGIYALIRGAIIHQYPYPFIDVNILGYPAVFRNIIILTIAYSLLGILILFVNNRFLALRRS